jgi:hypothetical protein
MSLTAAIIRILRRSRYSGELPISKRIRKSGELESFFFCCFSRVVNNDNLTLVSYKLTFIHAFYFFIFFQLCKPTKEILFSTGAQEQLICIKGIERERGQMGFSLCM